MTAPKPTDRFIKGTLIDDAIFSAVKSGFRSSEFVLSVIALVGAPLISWAFSLLDPRIAEYGTHGGWVAGLVVAVYTAARAYVKATVVKQTAAAEVIKATEPLRVPIAGVGNLTASEIRNLPPLGGGNPREL